MLKTTGVIVLDKLPDCQDQGCNKPAEYRCLWGEDSFELCEDHAAAMIETAEHLGYYKPAETMVALSVPNRSDTPPAPGGDFEAPFEIEDDSEPNEDSDE